MTASIAAAAAAPETAWFPASGVRCASSCTSRARSGTEKLASPASPAARGRGRRPPGWDRREAPRHSDAPRPGGGPRDGWRGPCEGAARSRPAAAPPRGHRPPPPPRPCPARRARDRAGSRYDRGLHLAAVRHGRLPRRATIADRSGRRCRLRSVRCAAAVTRTPADVWFSNFERHRVRLFTPVSWRRIAARASARAGVPPCAST